MPADFICASSVVGRNLERHLAGVCSGHAKST
jgi:hypothetical protein